MNKEKAKALAELIFDVKVTPNVASQSIDISILQLDRIDNKEDKKIVSQIAPIFENTIRTTLIKQTDIEKKLKEYLGMRIHQQILWHIENDIKERLEEIESKNNIKFVKVLENLILNNLVCK